MNLRAKYYTESLYPFQDGVLKLVQKSGAPFYLSGGTALSRGYYHHRYSDDLDLFVNDEPAYSRYVEMLFQSFETAQREGLFFMNYELLRRYENFSQFFLYRDIAGSRIELKVDVVNDVASHYGEFYNHPTLGKLDSWQNILSNKLTAVFRYEAKDLADIWAIAKHQQFDWRLIITEAKTKEVGMEPIAIFEILHSLPQDAFEAIKWCHPLTFERFMNDIDRIAADIFREHKNSCAEA